jgi:diguanylate cyclase (GGDEF)-like protein
VAIARVLILSHQQDQSIELAQMLAPLSYATDWMSLAAFLGGDPVPASQGIVLVADALTPTEVKSLGQIVERLRWSREAKMPFTMALTRSRDLEHALLCAGCDDVIVGRQSAQALQRRVVSLNRVGIMRRELARRRMTRDRFALDGMVGDGLEFDFTSVVSGQEPIRALLVGLDREAAGLLEPHLPPHFSFDRVGSSQEAMSSLYLGSYDACLIAASSTGLDARSLLCDLRNSPSLFSLPVIVAAADPSTSLEDSLVQSGATDVAHLPIDVDALTSKLEFGVRIERIRKQLASGFRAPINDLTRDVLTGLTTHGFILSHLGQVASDMAQSFGKVPVATVGVLDLNRINEALGYDAGDGLLRQVGSMIGRCLRLEDVAGRLSGSNFLIIFPESTFEQAQIAIGRLDAVLRNSTITLPNGDTIATRVLTKLHDWPCDQSNLGVTDLLASTRQIARAGVAA